MAKKGTTSGFYRAWDAVEKMAYPEKLRNKNVAMEVHVETSSTTQTHMTLVVRYGPKGRKVVRRRKTT